MYCLSYQVNNYYYRKPQQTLDSIANTRQVTCIDNVGHIVRLTRHLFLTGLIFFWVISICWEVVHEKIDVVLGIYITGSSKVAFILIIYLNDEAE